MCIALISTAHPAYSLILLDNRDEFLKRPTAPATWWPEPNEHVLAGRDLLRAEQGTWLGVTKDGRISVLTNFKEENELVGAQSRGRMIKSFLTNPRSQEQSTEEFVKELVASGAPQHVGGFSLVLGRIGEPLAVISNRVSSEKGISWIAGTQDETVGLSNAAFGDRSWKKIVSGEKLLAEAVAQSSNQDEGEDLLIQRLLDVLSTDTLPRQLDLAGNLEAHMNQLPNTIFVPVLGQQELETKPSDEVQASKDDIKAHVVENGTTPEIQAMTGAYGTQKQTVVLVRRDGTVRFFERTLFDDNAAPIKKGNGDVNIVFNTKE